VSSRSTASPRTTSDSSGRGPGARHCGRIRARAGVNGANVGSSGTGARRRAPSSASVSGRNADAVPDGTARPRSTGRPQVSAAATASRSIRDLPMPGGPVSATAPPRPICTLAIAERSVAISACRPTTTGQRTSERRAGYVVRRRSVRGTTAVRDAFRGAAWPVPRPRRTT
jgi:hypothetical protein